MTQTIHDRQRPLIEAANAKLTAHHAEFRPYTASYRRRARSPYILWSERGDFIARFASLEALEKRALEIEACA